MPGPIFVSDTGVTVRAVQVTSKWITDIEIERSKQRTRGNAQRTRRHHFVPQMYLKRWSDEHELVRFTDTVTGAGDIDLPEAIANEEFFYRIVGEDIDPDEHPDLWFETHMGRIEDKAAGWLRALDRLPDGRVKDPNLLHNLAVFIALQSQRTPRSRTFELGLDAALQRFDARTVIDNRLALPLICRTLGIPYSPQQHAEIVEQILARPDFSSDPTAKAIDNSIKVWRNHIVPMFACRRRWWLVSSQIALITCDEPVVPVQVPEWPRTRVARFDSPLLLYPIGPHRLLVGTLTDQVLTAPFALTAAEAEAVNFEIAAHCLRFVYEHPGGDIGAHLSLPPMPEFGPAQAATFWEAMSPPTRWNDAANPPSWPLQRWTT